MKSKIVNVTVPILVVLLMGVSTVHASEVASGVKESVAVCLESIVPSMYGFMIVADMLVRTNSHKAIGRVLSPVARYAFHLDGELFSVLLISLVAGYPVGARLVSTLERTHAIDSHTASKMYCYCYSGGLAFILGTVGGGSKYGMLVALSIYLSNVVANLLLAVLLNLRANVPNRDTSKVGVALTSRTLIDSIHTAFRTLLTVCTMVVAFSIAIALIGSLGVSSVLSQGVANAFRLSTDYVQSLLDALLEVSNVAHVPITGRYTIPTLAVLFSFGGVCVTLQIVSIAGEGFSLWKFLLARAFTCTVSFVVCNHMCHTYLEYYAPTGYYYHSEATKSTSIVPSICLMCMSFILLSKNTRHFSEKVI